MKLKTIWKHCSIIGISFVFLFLLCACPKEEPIIDYRVRANWIYINKTNHEISFQPKNIWDEFNVSPLDTITYFQNGGGPEIVTHENYVPPLNASKVVFNDTKCDSLLARKLRDVTSYEYKKIGERHYEFVFRYTTENTSNANDCE